MKLLNHYLWKTTALLLLFVSPVAYADCPNKVVSCNTAAFGWQGQCYKGVLKRCKSCGPKHCAKRPGMKSKFLSKKALIPKDNGEKCRKELIKKKKEDAGKGSACSFPDLPDKGWTRARFGMINYVFGRSACMEHDVCYAMPGMTQKKCDLMFLKNMRKNCKSYYKTQMKKHPIVKGANQPGYLHCKKAANLFYLAVVAKGASSVNPSSIEECKGLAKKPEN